MEINKISSQQIDMAKLYGADLESPETKTDSKDSTLAEISIDSESMEGFKALKDKVANSTQAGRASYIEKIKAAVLAGEYNVDATTLADSMIEDGFLEVLV